MRRCGRLMLFTFNPTALPLARAATPERRQSISTVSRGRTRLLMVFNGTGRGPSKLGVVPLSDGRRGRRCGRRSKPRSMLVTGSPGHLMPAGSAGRSIPTTSPTCGHARRAPGCRPTARPPGCLHQGRHHPTAVDGYRMRACSAAFSRVSQPVVTPGTKALHASPSRTALPSD